ncbi:MAG: DUF3276 family protein [Candidatus Melainabacteria bacterium]|jgi:hypothetical protein
MEEIIEENNRRDDRRDIFSEKVYAGKRTYYFDLNETSNGGKCLVISERKLTDGEYNERYKIMVFEENLIEFWKGLNRVVEYVVQEKTSEGF